jgi:hypothetical protein
MKLIPSPTRAALARPSASLTGEGLGGESERRIQWGESDQKTSRNGFRLFLEAKELKTAFVDRFFDGISGDFVRQVLIWPDRADCTPWLELGRQLNAGQIATERAQLGLGLGFEDENAHRALSLVVGSLAVGCLAVGCRAVVGGIV